MQNHIKRGIRLLLQNVHDSICYYPFKNRNLPFPLKRVVFVCKGNICRSVFAEHLLKAYLRGNAIEVDSCGLCADNETPAPFEAITTARKFGLCLDTHLSKSWECCNLESADLILAMEYWHCRKLLEYLPHKRLNIRLLRQFSSFPEKLFVNISDPYGRGEIQFGECFKLIENSLLNFIEIYKLNTEPYSGY